MAKKIVIDLEVNSNKGVKEVEKLNKNLKNTNKELSGATSALDNFTGGAVTKIKGFKGAISNLSKGFKSLRVAIISTGIGALIIAITSVAQAFRSTEEGQNKFSKLMAVLGAVTDVFTDRLASLGRGLINLFTSPIETLKNFGKSIKEFVMDKVDSAVKSLGLMGSAISKLFKGDFSGALNDYKDSIVGLNKALNPAVIIVDALTKSTKELVKELKEEAKIAGQIADQRAKADKLDRQLIVSRAKANRDRADLLEKAANKEKFTAKERIGFLTEAGKLEEDITNKEIKAAQLRLDAKVAENALGDSNKQDLEEEARLKAELINLETAKLTKQKLVTSQIVAAKREEIAKLKAIEDEEKARKEEEDKLKEEKQKEKDLQDKQRKDQKLKDDELRAQREIEIEQSIADRKKAINLNYINFAAGLSGLLQQIAGKNKALALAGLILEKGSAIANVVVKSKEAILTAKANEAKIPLFIPSPFGIPTVNPLKPASLAATTKQILGTKLSAGLAIAGITATAIGQGKSVGSGGAISSGGAIPAAAPPAFNVVGASDTNQLASAIGGQSQQPVKAYVVANDVTTSQSMDRNIVDDASLGG